ncbi:MAG: hypothetical protein PHW60_05345 [Kiritimatiellae bacterium]|nr:hypothetical protein [Kiritimatiellia bacterium]
MKTSPNFEGVVGLPVAAAEFPPANRITDKSRYALDGNWAFCRFDDPDIIGARFGLNRGFMNSTDYGFPVDQPDDGCALRVEILTREGAYLWIENNKYKAHDIHIPPRSYQHTLAVAGRDILKLSGWPVIRWSMSSDDGFLAIDVVLDPKTVVILPDHVLKNSRFSMWLAVCALRGSVTMGDSKKNIRGMAFYDHPRITRERNDVPEFGTYNYIPVRFNDGSCFISYYGETADGRRNDSYSFGYYLDRRGLVSEFKPDGIQTVTFDADDQLATCSSAWKSGSQRLSIGIRSEPIGVKKAWGTGNVPQTLKENRVFPLPFKCAAVIAENGVCKTISGVGLNEYMRNPKLPVI